MSNTISKQSEYYLVKPNGDIELVKINKDSIYNANFTHRLGEFYNAYRFDLKSYYRNMRVGTLENGCGLFNTFEEALISANIKSVRKRTIYYIYVDDDGTLQKSDVGQLINRKWVVIGTDDYWDIESVEEFLKVWEQQAFDVISQYQDVITVYHKHYRPDGRNLVKV